MSIRPLLFAGASLLLPALACGDNAVCVPGQSASCACPDGRTGAQICQPDGAGFGVCMCEDLPRDGGSGETDGGATSDAGSSDGGASDGGAGSSTDGALDAGPSSVDAGDPAHAPRIISLATNLSEITRSDTLVITAIVTDPDGIDDLIGGQLQNESGAATFDAFSTTAMEGSYETTIDWNTLHRDESIEAPSGGVERTLRVRFYDVAGNEATGSVTVRLVCSRRSDGICGGSCADFQTSDSHCGECGNAVVANSRCVDGVQECEGDYEFCDAACRRLDFDDDNCGSCGRSCAAEVAGIDVVSFGGARCSAGQCVFTARTTTYHEDCNAFCGSLGGTCDAYGFSSDGDCLADTGCAEYSGGGCFDEFRDTVACAEDFPMEVYCDVSQRGTVSAIECACAL